MREKISKKTLIEAISTGLLFLAVLGVLSSYASISLNWLVVWSSAVVFAFSGALILTALKLREQGLYRSTAVSFLAIVLSVVAGSTVNSSFTMPYLIISIIAGLTGLMICTGILEKAYYREGSFNEFLSRPCIRYSAVTGVIHTGIAISTYILAYGPQYFVNTLFSAKFIAGLTGSFLLAAGPAYLYLEEDRKIPIFAALGWIIWGLTGFIQNLDGEKVSRFFPPAEFVLPNNEAYFLSGILFVSILIIYLKIRKNRTRKQKFLKMS